MHQGIALTSATLAIVALALGVATRQLSRLTRFPYTILMLGVGVCAGLFVHRGEVTGHSGTLSELFRPAAELSPDMILFVFLPALVFESAYSVDVHVFKNNAGAIALFAVPSLLLATFATGALMLVIVPDHWNWGLPAALVFGSLISATDPVAVVAILREIGVSKRLGVLIEGESLLNDGTAIVIFGVLMSLLSGEQDAFHASDAILSFLWVVSGGIGVGLVLAFVVSYWIERFFDDALSEITLTLVMAYAAMIIAEAFLHVSGVMAVVTTGLWMSGTGRTKISPEVSHFLHRFWETLGYISNTLIFFLVGVVIAQKLEHAGWFEFGLVLATYLGIMVIRFALVFLAQPLATRLSDGVSLKDSIVISWGGLRGAVSLALALIVSQNPRIPEALGAQILFVTAGVVLLTIVVNGATMARLLSMLGYDKAPISVEVQSLKAQALVLERVSDELETLKSSPDLSTCQWKEVIAELEDRKNANTLSLESASLKLAEAPSEEREVAIWRRVLSLERQSYWEALSDGTLSGQAARILTREIARQLDAIARGKRTPPETRTPFSALKPSFFSRMLGGENERFGRLALLYDVSRAEAQAATHVLDSLHIFSGRHPDLLALIRRTYLMYRTQARVRVEDLRVNLPEVAAAIETRLARRIELNIEKEALKELERGGLVSESNARQEFDDLQERMGELKQSATRVPIAETADLVAATPLFSGLEPDALKELAHLTEEIVLPAGEVLFHEGDKGDSLYVVARGMIRIDKRVDGETVQIDVLGGGDVIGEIALLTGEARTATATTGTAATLGLINRAGFESLLNQFPTLRSRFFKEAAWRRFDNRLRSMARYSEFNRADRRRWFDLSEIHHIEEEQRMKPGKSTTIFLAMGEVSIGERTRKAPALFEVHSGEEGHFAEGAYWLTMGRVVEPQQVGSLHQRR